MSEEKKTDAAVKKDHGVLYIGMDLGTSRTSVSASNGVRETVYSVVGYPKDVVSQKLLKKDVLFGEDARAHVDSVMLCSEPFSVAYGLDWLEDVLVIDIGAGTTDLCRMHGTMPEETDQVMYDVAGDAVDAELTRLIREIAPQAQFTT